MNLVHGYVLDWATRKFGLFLHGDMYSHTYGWLYRSGLRCKMAKALTDLRHETLDLSVREHQRRALFVCFMRMQTEEEAYEIRRAIPDYEMDRYAMANRD